MSIDFTDFPKRNKTYTGANGSKISIVYNGELYMLKFPPHPSKNRELSYSNSCFSEYLGCKIFQSIGLPVQEVTLGTYTTPGGNKKIVVACKDFTTNGKVIQDFASLKNQIIDSEKNGYGTELHDILDTFETQNAVDSKELSTRFWHMFIVDALIGNWDRHNGNWGFLYEPSSDTMELAPVFDCGSCMYPQANDEIMENILNDRQKLNHRIYNIPTSAIKENDSRINYFDFISALKNLLRLLFSPRSVLISITSE